MKILINTTNGKIIAPTKAMRGADIISCNKYDNGVYYKNAIIYQSCETNFNRTTVPTEYYNYPDYMDWLTEDTLLKKYPTYSLVVKTNINWCFNKGGTGINTVVRINIPNEIIGNFYQTGNAIDTLLTSWSTLTAYRTRGNVAIVQYLESLSAGDIATLNAYLADGVIIDWKDFNVNFTIQSLGVPVQNAVVNCNGKTATSDAAGLATIELPQGTFAYVVTYPDGGTMSGNVTIVRNNVNLTVNKT
jgi:hypothetical protein